MPMRPERMGRFCDYKAARDFLRDHPAHREPEEIHLFEAYDLD
jgi:hypothetical protein